MADTTEPDIWADMVAELEPLKKQRTPTPAQIAERIRVGSKVRTLPDWILNCGATPGGDIGEVVEIYPDHQTIIAKAPNAELGEFRILIPNGMEWWTNRYFIVPIE